VKVSIKKAGPLQVTSHNFINNHNNYFWCE